jgi:hypothetical protein
MTQQSTVFGSILLTALGVCLHPVALRSQCNRVFIADGLWEVHWSGRVDRYDSVVTGDDGVRYAYMTGDWVSRNGELVFDSLEPRVAYSMLPNGDVYFGDVRTPRKQIQYRLCSAVGESWMITQKANGNQNRIMNLGTDGIRFAGRTWLGQRFLDNTYVPKEHGSDTNTIEERWAGHIHTIIDSLGMVWREEYHTGRIDDRVYGVVLNGRIIGDIGTSVAGSGDAPACMARITGEGQLELGGTSSARRIRVVTPLGQVLATFTGVEDFNTASATGAFRGLRYGFVAIEGASCTQTLVIRGEP